MSQSQPDKNKNAYLLKSSIMGAIRGLVGLPIEHPLQTLKTKMQVQSSKLSPWKLIRQVYEQEGLKGYYAGLVPNAVRVALKQIYRFPLIIYLPTFISEHAFKRLSIVLDSKTSKSITGFAISFVEVFFICPAERLKVWLMTKSRTDMRLSLFFKQNNVLKQLFQGLNLMFLRQAASWVSFLVVDDFCKKQLRRHLNLAETQPLDFNHLMIISAVVGIANILAVMPFDVAKTLQQKQGAVPRKVISVFREIFKTGGLVRLYAGWDFRFVHYMVQSIFTVHLYDYLETGYKKITSH